MAINGSGGSAAKGMKMRTEAKTIVAVVAIVATGFATANAQAAETIKIRGNSPKTLRFDGPKEIKSGERLTIVNQTGPRRIGPHTFTLAAEKFIPSTGSELRTCIPDGPCGDVGKAHKIDPDTFAVGEPRVERGQTGFDAIFNSDHFGDSEFFGANAEELSRTVTVEPHRVLHFFCAVHPQMQGKIRVVR